MGEDQLRTFAQVMSQVGITAFALMFTAVHVRWLVPLGRERVRGVASPKDEFGAPDELARSRLGKLAAATALLELLVVTLVSTALSSDPRSWVWRAVAVAATATGLAATGMHVMEYRRRVKSGYLPTPADRFQNGVWWLPVLSYTVLGAAALSSYRCPAPAPLPGAVLTGWPLDSCSVFPAKAEDAALANLLHSLGTWDGWLAGVWVWLLISGLIEVYVTLSPHLLNAEPSQAPFGHTTRFHEDPRPIRFAEFAPDPDTAPRMPVILLPEMWGVTPVMLDISAWLARRGHAVFVVDYHTNRRGQLLIKGRILLSDRYAQDQARRYAREALAVRAWIGENRGHSSVAVVGFSIGGTAALEQAHRWSRVAALYPSKPSTFKRLASCKTPMFLGWGDRDRKAEKGAHAELEVALKDQENVSVQKFGAARHGFMGTRGAWLIVRLAGHCVYGPEPVESRRALEMLGRFLDSSSVGSHRQGF